MINHVLARTNEIARNLRILVSNQVQIYRLIRRYLARGLEAVRGYVGRQLLILVVVVNSIFHNNMYSTRARRSLLELLGGRLGGIRSDGGLHVVADRCWLTSTTR